MKALDLSHSVIAAQQLLGCKLVHESAAGRTAGIIVETEAYHQDDPASHTFKGKTKRNRAMFGPAGYAYIYFTYGMHYCFNVVTGPSGVGQGVLIRALEPTEGIDLMRQRRGTDDVLQLTNGPAKLVQAMAITMQHYGHNLLRHQELFIEAGNKPPVVVPSVRIGIKKAVNVPWRFYIKDNRFVSRPTAR